MIEEDYQEDAECALCEVVFYLLCTIAAGLLGSAVVQFIDWWQS